MKYAATFSNGATLKRNSPRSYEAAWLVCYDWAQSGERGQSAISGFAGTMDLAAKALSSETNRLRKNPRIAKITFAEFTPTVIG